MTFAGCLFWSLEYGILVGIGINLMMVLYHSARPEVESEVTQVLSFSQASKLVVFES